MAFGVKWNETGKENDCEPAEGRAASPEVRGRRAPGADPAVGCECGGCTPRPETPSSDSAPDRTGRGGGGGTEPSAIFPYSPKHTDTLPGRRLGVCGAKVARSWLVQTCGPHDTYFQKHPDQNGESRHLEPWEFEPQLCWYLKTQHWFDDLLIH